MLKKVSFPRIKPKSYDEVRKNICSGDILLCAGNGFFSKLIQKVTNSDFSHVGFVIRLDEIDRIMVLESVESIGVRTVPLSHYVSDYKGNGEGYNGRLLMARHEDIAKTSLDKMNKMSKFAVDLFGYPYDNDEILKIGARIAQGLLGYKKSEVQRDREYICSEYAWECYKQLGIKIPYDKRGFIAPKDFMACSKVKSIVSIKTERNKK